MIPKFRVWDESIRYMDYRVRVTTTDDYIKVEVLDAFSDWRELEERQYELMQSTGLKDKNGKEIFEGDIVEYIDGEYSFIGVTVKSPFGWFVRSNDNYSFEDFSDDQEGTSDVEVIGCIYENQELLEVTDD